MSYKLYSVLAPPNKSLERKLSSALYKKIMKNRNILIINGSTRTNGNTDILVNKIIEGAQNSQFINLKDRKIANCIGCMQCLGKGICSIDDDMTEIRKAIQNADILFFASPLYWGSITGLMKTFIDRLFFYYHPPNKPLISGKKAIIVTPMNQRTTDEETKILKEFYNCLLNCLEVEILNFFFFGGIMGKGDVLKNQEYLEKAYLIGKNLINKNV